MFSKFIWRNIDSVTAEMKKKDTLKFSAHGRRTLVWCEINR